MILYLGLKRFFYVNVAGGLLFFFNFSFCNYTFYFENFALAVLCFIVWLLMFFIPYISCRKNMYQFIKQTIILVIWRYAQIIRKRSYVICYFIGKEDRLFSRQIAVICTANVIQTGSFVFWRIKKLRWDASLRLGNFGISNEYPMSISQWKKSHKIIHWNQKCWITQ